MSKKEVLLGLGLAVLALIVRLPYLGSFMTIDEVKWLEGAGQFLLGLRRGTFFETYWHFHPGITITWGEAIILWGQYLSSEYTDLTLFVTDQVKNLAGMVGPMRLSGVIITSLSAAGIYWLARPLLGHRPALLGAGLLAVDPFFVAHSRIVNGDAGVAGFMMLAFLAFVHLWQNHRGSMAILAGIMAGLALLTKLPSPIILPWVVVLAGLGFSRDKDWRAWFKGLLLFTITAGLTFVILWPAMWVAPLETLRLLVGDAFAVGEVGSGHETFFLGQVGDDPGWFFYPYVIAFRLTPLVVIGLVSLLFWLWRGRSAGATTPTKTMLVIAMLIYVVFVITLANLSPKKLDRYVMAVIPALTLLAGVGLDWLITKLIAGGKNRLKLSSRPVYLSGLLGLLIIIGQTSFTVANYPYILTYYNPLLGGYERAARQIPVGWGEGIEQAAAWVNTQPNAPERLVSAWYSDIVRPYLTAGTTSFSSSGKEQLAADYVIFYINQAQRQKPNRALFNYFKQQTPLFQVDHRGYPYAWVYQAPHMQQPVSGKNKIVGRGALLGYSWQPAPPTQAGAVTGLTLFLHTTDMLPANETFAVSLASTAPATGETLWGTWVPAADNAWQAEAIVEWQGDLHLPADLPAGLYRLVVRLMDTNVMDTNINETSGQDGRQNGEVTRFPLEEATVFIE